MEPKAVVEHLKTIPLFQNFREERKELELYHLVPIVHEAHHDIGEWLFVQGEPSNRLYVILEGTLRLTLVDREGITHHLKDVGPGTVFGETGLLVGDVHDATAEVLRPLHVLYLEREEFSEVLDQRPKLRRNLVISPEVEQRRSISRFDWMREDEWVVFAAKRHWAYLLRQILPPLLLLLVFTPLLYILLTSTAPMRAIFAFFITVFLISLVLLITYQYFNWKDDLFVMTTQRIVHIERVWPFRQEFEESSLENIQDIYELRPSLASQVLSFGDLILLTAGETVEIDLLGVPNPNRLRELIFREIERHRALSVLRSRGAIRDVLERRLRLEPPPPLPESETVEKPNASLAMVALVSLKEYFFPSSWVVSEDGNTIIWRRFWFPGFLRYLQIFIPFAVSTIGGAWFLASIWAAESMHWLLGVWLVLEAGLFGASIWFLEDWRNDYFQITPNRIMLVFRKPLLLQESRRETSLGQIQNISFEVPGILANFFKYGHVMLETAGATGKFELKWVRYPQKIQGEISQRQREYKQRQEEMESRRRLQELTSWFATYDALRNPSEATAEQDAPSVETTPDS